MSRPINATEYDEINLKLGIKSSLPHVKSTVALAILMWECADHPATLAYSVQDDIEIVLAPKTEQAIIDYLTKICAEEQIDSTELINIINQNQLFKSQMEPLMVAFELVWKIAKVSFIDETKSASSERKGGIRYPKKLLYSVNMDIIHSAICTNEKENLKVLLSWIGVQISCTAEYENALLHMLTALSELAIFKLAADEQDIIFYQNGIYQQLLVNSEAVNIDDVKEAKGPLRILKSLLSDGMNPYLQGSGRNVTANPNEDLANYQARVETFLQLSSTKVINNEQDKEPAHDFNEQKARFRTWLEKQVKPEGDSEAGQPYSPNTIDQYVSNLDNTYLPNGKSVFSTFDIDEVKQCAEELKNTEPKNNTQKSALQKYIEFLVSNQKPVFHTGYEHPKGFANNRIIFGAPGTGKSFTINNDRKDLLGEDNEVDYERVTFHPDYSYANFVGTYKPVPCKKHNDKGEEEDSITYEYVPGPFMRMYVKALKNARTDSPKPFLLIIEEINRANVAAVFGDVFQLLDRGDDNVSEYPIEASEDIKKYLARELGGDLENYSKIRIPDNMFIWATMNSADQGVYPMDTAFKRRWDFTYLGIDDSDKDIRDKYVYIAGKKVIWNELRKAINKFLADNKINEDKQLGPYFIARNIVVPMNGGSEIDSDKFCKVFKNKVLMYLFEDAAKQKRPSLFEGCKEGCNRYSKICETFDKKGIDIFLDEISRNSNVLSDETNAPESNENGLAREESDE